MIAIIISSVILAIWSLGLTASLLRLIRKEFNKISTMLGNFFQTIKDNMELQNSYLKAFDRNIGDVKTRIIAIPKNVPVVGNQVKVWAFFLSRSDIAINPQQMLLITTGINLQEATVKAFNSIDNMEGLRGTAWNVLMSNSLDVIASEAPAVERALEIITKGPHDFINSLAYVREKFTTKPSEKKILTQIMNSIKEKYATK